MNWYLIIQMKIKPSPDFRSKDVLMSRFILFTIFNHISATTGWVSITFWIHDPQRVYPANFGVSPTSSSLTPPERWQLLVKCLNNCWWLTILCRYPWFLWLLWLLVLPHLKFKTDRHIVSRIVPTTLHLMSDSLQRMSSDSFILFPKMSKSKWMSEHILILNMHS